MDVGDRIGLHLNGSKWEVIHAPEVTLSSPILTSFVDVHPDVACLYSVHLFSEAWRLILR